MWQRLSRPLTRVAQICAIALAITGCQRSSVDADRNHTAAFYRGRTVRIIVGVSPGGGQDLYARVMAPHFARQLEGEPNVIVENMPGAGGLVAATYLAHSATPDGLTIGLLGPQPTINQLGPQASFDVRTLPIIGSPADDGPVCVFGHERGYTLDAWRRGRTPRLGMTKRGSATAAYGLLLTEALGLAVKPVTGYPGTADIKAAIVSGEIDGVCLSRNSFAASFQPLSEYDVILQTTRPESTMFPEVPTADQLVTSERGRTLLKIVEAVGTLSRYYAAPPGTPSSRVDALRSAFLRTMQSSEFLAAAAAAQLEIRPQTHMTLSAHIDALLASTPEVRREMAALLNSGS
jgi:tripartite-type tricarboxylate transporter receptor subunit TctC